MTRANQIISLLTGSLVAFLALAAFVLSFDALRHLAAANGVAPGMAWLYPAIIDGAIIIFSLSVLQASLNRERTRYPWALVGLFTALSIGLNVLHAPTAPLPRLLAAVPPIALFLSFELLMNQVKSLVRRLELVQRLQELATAVQHKQTELDTLIANKRAERDTLMQEPQTAVHQLDTQVHTLMTRKEEVLNELKQLRQEKRGLQLSNTDSITHARAQREVYKQASLDAMLTYLADNPDASLAAIAAAIGRSRSTAGNYVNELVSNGRLHKNGQGWEILEIGE
ncbi:MAG TPA: DUF2637 domain-containing protein [Chloroflexota bacterium]|nr:DUF2637 domain-containing protein [Chloroflexota bacterium]